jgi:uncharacterized membrane protein
MQTTAYDSTFDSIELPSRLDLERWSSLFGAALLIGYGLSRRSLSGLCLAAGAAPLAYRAATGRWPIGLHALTGRSDDTRAALGGGGGIRVRESIRLETSVDEVFRFWKRLENLPRFMTNVLHVTDKGGGHSHWVARGPGGVRVEWDAEIINEIQNRVIAWRSLPGGDVVSAGSVTFAPAREDRGTQLTVSLQYDPPAGWLGAGIAWLLGRAPAQTIREDLRRMKQLVEAGEVARATPDRPADVPDAGQVEAFRARAARGVQ